MEQRGLCPLCNIKTLESRAAPSPLRPSREGWFEERGQPPSTSSRVPRQGSPSALSVSKPRLPQEAFAGLEPDEHESLKSGS